MTGWGRRRRGARTATLIVIAALLASCGLVPRATPAGSPRTMDLRPRVADRFVRGDGALVATVPDGRRAWALMDLAAYATPGGGRQSWLGEARPIMNGQDLVILGDPVIVRGTQWLRVYAVPTLGAAGDFFTWIPATQDGAPTVGMHLEETCPPTRDNLSTIAALDPFTRVHCLGADSFTVEGRTEVARLPTAYPVDPAWLGAWDFGSAAFSLQGGAGHALEVRVPPGLPPPPVDITVRATVHLADPVARDCSRGNHGLDAPAEAGTDSRLWCTVQVVAESWTPSLGAEGLPFDPARPQLHRFPGNPVCGLSGSMPMTFHTDPYALDPVWLEPPGGGEHVVAWFGPEFRVAFRPDLVVVDAAGRVVARDGMPVDPDARDIAGHYFCAGRYTLLIS